MSVPRVVTSRKLTTEGRSSAEAMRIAPVTLGEIATWAPARVSLFRFSSSYARATIVTLGLEESVRLGLAKGAKASTFLGLAGAGDFMLTANSLQSRNTTLGVALGEGRKLVDVLAGRKHVTEGAFSAEGAAALARWLHVEVPITDALDGLLNRGDDLEQAMGRFLHRLPPLYRAG